MFLVRNQGLPSTRHPAATKEQKSAVQQAIQDIALEAILKVRYQFAVQGGTYIYPHETYGGLRCKPWRLSWD